MVCKIVYSPLSLNDLNGIYDYIEGELKNPEAAADTISNIIKSINILKNFPDSGARLKKVVNIESGYRFVAAGNFMSFYRHEGDCVYIDRILYGQRDYLRILFENNE